MSAAAGRVKRNGPGYDAFSNDSHHNSNIVMYR